MPGKPNWIIKDKWHGIHSDVNWQKEKKTMNEQKKQLKEWKHNDYTPKVKVSRI